MPTITLPSLEDRAPSNQYVHDLVDRMTNQWVQTHYDRLMELAGAAKDDADWIAAVRFHNELVSHYATHSARASLAFRQASDDEPTVAEYKRFVGELGPALSRRDIEFERAIDASGSVEAIAAKFGPVWRDQLRTSLITNDPVNIDISSEVSDVLMEHTAIFGKLTIEWQGERHPWSFARKAANDPNVETRRAAHVSMVDAIRGAAPELQQIFDQVLALRGTMADNLGLPSYTDLRYLEMGRSDWDREDAKRFRAGVEAHVVPLARELREEQARQQGAPNGVHPADLEIWPENRAPELTVGVDEQLAVTRELLEELGDAFGQPFGMLVDEGLIDLPARPGKGNGAFCTSFPDQRVPYLFCNSVGTPEDVRTLIHEYGHGLQTWRSRDIELVSLRFPTLEACEIHSMSLELLALPQMGAFFGDTGAEDFRLEQMRGTVMMLPYIASVDEFQHAIYDPARTAPITAEERTDLWRELTLRYRQGIDWDADPWFRDNLWLRQLHIFHYPFYYLDYALAQTVAWQLWLKSLEDPAAALETYLRLCDAGGTKPFRQLVLDAGLEDPFDPAVLERVIGELRHHVGLPST